MAQVKVLARGWLLEIQNPDTLLYTEVKGLSSLTFDGSKNDADTTSFDNQGRQTHVVASRTNTLSIEGYYLEDQTTKERDAGQELVEDLADQIDVESIGVFRLTSPAGIVRDFEASANVSGIGGGNDDPTGWSAELTVTGQIDLSTTASAGASATSFVQTDGSTALTAYAITPAFANGTYLYNVTYTTQTSFKPKVTASSHTIKLYIDGVYSESLTSGSAGTAIAMSAGTTKKLDIVVFEAGKSKLTYTYMISRLS